MTCASFGAENMPLRQNVRMDDNLPPRQPVVRGAGTTAAERYLKRLCDATFLSMWSYPGVYRDQRSKANTEGKEVCDLLVVFENDIVIFSDKDCEFRRSGDLQTNWSRWFRKAVIGGAEQLWGAERWIRRFPERLFLDRACTQPFPFPLPDLRTARFHLVLVTHGVSPACADVLGGSGSLVIESDRRGFQSHTVPFVVGDLDPDRAFVHVLDDTTLDIVLRTRDTIADLTAYLRKKEAFLRGRDVFAAGEEELLAAYFKMMNEAGEHDFVFPPHVTGGIAIPEGHWLDFSTSKERKAQIEHDAISYSWDALIEKFNYYALRGDQYLRPSTVRDIERTMRFLAREPRPRRRMLAVALNGLVHKIPGHTRGTRVIAPSSPGDPYYAFLVLPVFEGMTHREYRELRGGFLDALVRVVKLTFPDAEDIIGIATESGIDTEPRTEDAAYIDARDWCKELQRDAVECQQRLKLLVNVSTHHEKLDEFPQVTLAGQLLHPPGKNPRNKPCPCRSGKKYKHCHGR